MVTSASCVNVTDPRCALSQIKTDRAGVWPEEHARPHAAATAAQQQTIRQGKCIYRAHFVHKAIQSAIHRIARSTHD